MRPFIRAARSLAWLLGLAVLLGTGHPLGARQSIRPSNREFWHLVTEFSEPTGTFPQQLMSNEDSAQFVMPELQKMATGGAYIGVGAEQNFTYIATQHPDLAFIIDIRRDNLLEVLLYKAVFEISPTRAEFVHRLFSRLILDNWTRFATAEALLASAEDSPTGDGVLETRVRAVLDRLVQVDGFALSDADQAAIRRMMTTFKTAGPRGLKGYGDRTNPTYLEFMTATDLDGRQHGFLSSDSLYDAVRAMMLENRIIPVTGDFAGDKALPAIGRFLRERKLPVRVFYVSNVERYLFEQGDHGRQFYTNVASLPLDDSSVFIRSVITDIADRLKIPVPAGPARWRTFVFSIRDCLAGVADGRIRSYGDLFTGAR